VWSILTKCFGAMTGIVCHSLYGLHVFTCVCCCHMSGFPQVLKILRKFQILFPFFWWLEKSWKRSGVLESTWISSWKSLSVSSSRLLLRRLHISADFYLSMLLLQFSYQCLSSFLINVPAFRIQVICMWQACL